MKRAISIVAILGSIYLIFSFYQFSTFVNNMGECGLSNGPCEGIDIKLQPEEMKIDHYIDIPNGQLAFMNIDNNLSPIIIKLNANQKIQWAKKLITETDNCEIPMYKMGILNLKTTEKEVIINFLNQSYSEPGKIYLDADYNFKMMCLSPF